MRRYVRNKGHRYAERSDRRCEPNAAPDGPHTEGARSAEPSEQSAVMYRSVRPPKATSLCSYHRFRRHRVVGSCPTSPWDLDEGVDFGTIHRVFQGTIFHFHVRRLEDTIHLFFESLKYILKKYQDATSSQHTCFKISHGSHPGVQGWSLQTNTQTR